MTFTPAKLTKAVLNGSLDFNGCEPAIYAKPRLKQLEFVKKLLKEESYQLTCLTKEMVNSLCSSIKNKDDLDFKFDEIYKNYLSVYKYHCYACLEAGMYIDAVLYTKEEFYNRVLQLLETT